MFPKPYGNQRIVACPRQFKIYRTKTFSLSHTRDLCVSLLVGIWNAGWRWLINLATVTNQRAHKGIVRQRTQQKNKRKNSHILPTGQWYAPSAVNYSALSCTNLHFFALSCTILHYLALSCTIMHYLAQSCTILHYLALSCTILHYLAQS